MKNPLNFHQLIGYFLPGFIFLFCVLCIYYNWRWDDIFDLRNDINSTATATLLSATAIILATFIGLIFDAFRNGIIEDWIDKKPNNKITWKYFQTATEEKLDSLYKRYYSYYVFDRNSVTALICTIIYSAIHECILFRQTCHCDLDWNKIVVNGLIIFAIGILCKDAKSLRKEIVDFTK
jgi:hypothetical protein